MKVADFERAILALGVDIIIDGMQQSESGVEQVTGHTDKEFLLWDRYGRGFSATKDSKTSLFLCKDEGDSMKITEGFEIERRISFDLKFD